MSALVRQGLAQKHRDPRVPNRGGAYARIAGAHGQRRLIHRPALAMLGCARDLGSPQVERCLGHLDLRADISIGRSNVSLPRGVNDLFLDELRLLHRPLPSPQRNDDHSVPPLFTPVLFGSSVRLTNVCWRLRVSIGRGPARRSARARVRAALCAPFTIVKGSVPGSRAVLEQRCDCYLRSNWEGNNRVPQNQGLSAPSGHELAATRRNCGTEFALSH